MVDEYDMGFRATTAPLTQRERYELLVESFVESGDGCISKECETVGEARRVQGGLSKAVKEHEGSARVKREGTTVYVMRRG